MAAVVVRRSYLRPGPGEIPVSDLLRPRGAAKKALHCYRGQLPAAGSGRRWRRSGCRRRATYHLRPGSSCGHRPIGAPYDDYLSASRLGPRLRAPIRRGPIFRMLLGIVYGRLVVTQGRQYLGSPSKFPVVVVV